jgi:hypothetical protein
VQLEGLGHIRVTYNTAADANTIMALVLLKEDHNFASKSEVLYLSTQGTHIRSIVIRHVVPG